MKKYYSLAVACVALFFCSCRKDDVNGTMLNSTNSAQASANADETVMKLLPSKSVNYGALIDAPDADGSLNFQLNVADQLGVSCLRSRTIVPGKGKVPILNYGYKVLLNFNGNYQGTPIPFATDQKKYESDLKSILVNFTIKPVVAVIENEENNDLFYSGTAQQYITQLSTAINVMHSYGIKTTNGGITGMGLKYLVYQDFMNQGKVDSAKDFQKRTRLALKDLKTQDRAAFIDVLLSAYASMKLDYVNFHWKASAPDTLALNETINYLQKRTNKTIITNELGQFDTDQNTLTSQVQLCTNRKLPYVIWYSPDEQAQRKGFPLQYSDASLTNTGVAYKNYLHY